MGNSSSGSTIPLELVRQAERLLVVWGVEEVVARTGMSKDTVLLIKKGRHRRQVESRSYIRCEGCGGLLIVQPCRLCHVRAQKGAA